MAYPPKIPDVFIRYSKTAELRVVLGIPIPYISPYDLYEVGSHFLLVRFKHVIELKGEPLLYPTQVDIANLMHWILGLNGNGLLTEQLGVWLKRSGRY